MKDSDTIFIDELIQDYKDLLKVQIEQTSVANSLEIIREKRKIISVLLSLGIMGFDGSEKSNPLGFNKVEE